MRELNAFLLRHLHAIIVGLFSIASAVCCWLKARSMESGKNMPNFTFSIRLTILLPIVFVIAACSTFRSHSPFISAEPEQGSVQTRTPQTLRLYFEQLPDVPRSTVTLKGPNGNLNIRGMHSMGANDLMMEINDQVVDGNYTVNWTTLVGEDPNEYQGEFSFTVQAN